MIDFNDLPPLPFELPQGVVEKASKIRLALFDVDGVLTDGSLNYGPQGEEVKVFNALDGHGLKMLQLAGIQVGIISARKSVALQTRLSDLSIQHCYLGVSDKVSAFHELLDKTGLSTEQCSFTGDDVIDLAVMLKCGLRFSVQNGHFVVREMADWVAPIAGGKGAVRAICDVLLYCNKSYPLDHSATQ